MIKRALFTISCLLIQANIWATQSVDSLLNLLDTNQTDTIQANIYYDLSKEYLNTNYKKSVMYAKKGKMIADKLNNKKLIARGLYYEGVGFTNLGLFRRSYDKITKSLQLFTEVQDTFYIISCIKNIGNLYWYENNYNKALEHFRKADSLIKTSTFNENQIDIYTNIGIVYTSLLQKDSALHYLNKAKTLIEREDNINKYKLGIVYLNIGGFYENINDDSAIYYYNKSLEYKDHYQSRVSSFIYSSIGHININRNNLKTAKNALDSAKKLADTDSNLLALRKYYMVKFTFDTTTNNSTQAIKTHINYKAIEDSLHKQSHIEKTKTNKAIYELHKQENEITQLKFENDYYKIRAQKNQFIIFLLSIIMALSALTLLVYLKLHKENRKIIKNLNNKNEDLINHKEELSTLNEEILVQREELYKKNKELQKTIQQLHDAQVQIIQSEKLATIGLLASGVAHEINNPLNFINAGLQQITELCQEDNLQNQQKETLLQSARFIEDGIHRAAKITEALGTINKPARPEKTKVDLNEIIRNTIKLISYKITNDIELIENYGEINSFMSYPDKIQSIIIHIIANAIEAVESHLSDLVKFLKVSTWKTDDFENEKICILIENSGDHLSKSTLQKIFDPFYTTKDNKNGVGLGLFIVYNLVKELEGKITAENTDIGISFNIEIPIQKEHTN